MNGTSTNTMTISVSTTELFASNNIRASAINGSKKFDNL
jgi:hypothetical protein